LAQNAASRERRAHVVACQLSMAMSKLMPPNARRSCSVYTSVRRSSGSVAISGTASAGGVLTRSTGSRSGRAAMACTAPSTNAIAARSSW